MVLLLDFKVAARRRRTRSACRCLRPPIHYAWRSKFHLHNSNFLPLLCAARSRPDKRPSNHQPATTRRPDKMKLNISYPANGSQKLVEIEDDRKLRVFMDRRMGQEVPGDSVGDEFKGYVFRITGGNDKQGFPMKQGVMHPTRVRLLLGEGHSCYRPRRTGERKRKSVRGCIVAADLAVLSLAIVKQGDAELPGLTDTVHPKRLGPKRATKIRRFFGLSKEDDVSTSNEALFLFASPSPCLLAAAG